MAIHLTRIPFFFEQVPRTILNEEGSLNVTKRTQCPFYFHDTSYRVCC